MSANDRTPIAARASAKVGKRRGPEPKAIISHPTPSSTSWIDPHDFGEALALHMERHGDTIWHLHRAVVRKGETFNRTTIRDWKSGLKSPRSALSLQVLERIEDRYQLPRGYFQAKVPHPARACTLGSRSAQLTSSERRRLAWHLPADFDRQSTAAQEEMLAWVRENVVSGSTDYRRYQREAIQDCFGLRFDLSYSSQIDTATYSNVGSSLDRRDQRGRPPAPQMLASEFQALAAFKTATLTDLNYERCGQWKPVTAEQKAEHLGLLFGALVAAPDAAVKGRGLDPSELTLALLVIPAVWDWYLRWRQQRRGFLTSWEANMLQFGMSLTRHGTGWLRQNPHLGRRLRPIPGLLGAENFQAIAGDWDRACDTAHHFLDRRLREVIRVARVHRDPFEPILPVLEAPSPLREYRRIGEEIIRRMPDRRRHARAAAEALRSYLMLRIALHLGVRQKNLRELRICPIGERHTPEKRLEALQVGELRWDHEQSRWEVLIPASAFKNSNSTFFGGRPFRLTLQDIDSLYKHLAMYLVSGRALLLGRADDPGTFFVKTAKRTTETASFSQAGFYEAWRLITQRYGIYNPYTRRGAIKGLLPHGPHNVRDVLATHILKQTGSFEQASYAIQDTPEMVSKHYGRFLPQDKTAMCGCTQCGVDVGLAPVGVVQPPQSGSGGPTFVQPWRPLAANVTCELSPSKADIAAGECSSADADEKGPAARCRFDPESSTLILNRKPLLHEMQPIGVS